MKVKESENRSASAKTGLSNRSSSSKITVTKVAPKQDKRNFHKSQGLHLEVLKLSVTGCTRTTWTMMTIICTTNPKAVAFAAKLASRRCCLSKPNSHTK